MKNLKKAIIMRGMYSMHFLSMIVLFFACWFLFYRIPAISGVRETRNLAICLIYAILLLIFTRLYCGYKVGFSRVGELIYSQVLANLVSLGVTYVLACVLTLHLINPLAGFGIAAVQAIFCVFWTKLANGVYFSLHKPKRTVIVYRNKADLEKLEEIGNYKTRWKIEKRVEWAVHSAHDLPHDHPATESVSRKDIHALIEQIKEYDVVFVSGVNATLRNGIVKYCVETNKECFFVPHTGDVIVRGAEHIRSFAVPICRSRRCSPKPEFLFVKRAFDILVSLIAIVVLSPFMLLTALAIKRYDHGPVLYKQVRLTKDGKHFEILKFRSMKIDAEKDGVARLSSEKDDRITPVGKIIRAIRFDELPQLFNILKGDMSIVGPRPERPEIAEQYMKELPAFDLRLQVKAGLTGYAQVYGRYNTEPQDKLKMDLMYINHIGVVEDLKLMFATVRILFMRESTEGVAQGQTTASKSDVEKSA